MYLVSEILSNRFVVDLNQGLFSINFLRSLVIKLDCWFDKRAKKET